MADTLALEKLYGDVVTQFTADSTGVPNSFGWREPRHRGGQQNRICWVPGDPSGSAGEVEGAHSPGVNPRSIGTMLETFTIYVEGRDATDLENELKQWKATRLIFDAWFRAAYLSVKNLLTIKSTAWMVDRSARRYGATLRAVCTVQAKIPDTAYTAAADVDAEVEIELDSDRDETTSNTSEVFDAPSLDEV